MALAGTVGTYFQPVRLVGSCVALLTPLEGTRWLLSTRETRYAAFETRWSTISILGTRKLPVAFARRNA